MANRDGYGAFKVNQMSSMIRHFRLMVIFLCVDRPDPPTDLELSDPHERDVRLSWVPGKSNHNPITGMSHSTHKHYCFFLLLLIFSPWIALLQIT